MDLLGQKGLNLVKGNEGRGRSAKKHQVEGDIVGSRILGGLGASAWVGT